MAYSILNIIEWAKICQPLAAIGEKERLSLTGGTVDTDLHIKIYLTRKDVEYAYNQDPAGEELFIMGNYLLMLLGQYIFQAQAQTGSGGSISPISPQSIPEPYEFTVSGSSFIATGATSKTITDFIGFNLLFVRGNITQSTVNNGASYYSWDRTTGLFQLADGSGGSGNIANAGELFQLYPLV